MSTKENIYKAMGSLAYAIAKADGEIQEEEKQTIQKLAQQEFELSDVDNEWISNMFLKLEKEQIDLEDAYQFAIDTLEASRFGFEFDEVMKKKCLRFMERTAEAFSGTSLDERIIINRFKKDLLKF